MHKQWRISTINPKLQVQLSEALSVHPIIAQLLINRNLKDVELARQFLSSGIDQLYDPFRLKGLEGAVKRIQKAKDAKEKILVFGDYDVDGVTSSAVLYRVLKQMGVDVYSHIPHRLKDGYGLNHEIADTAKEMGVGLLITVDCGITAVSEIETLNRLGIDVVVIDHHEPSEEGLPPAFSIINPKQSGCSYPSKNLSSVGLVYKLTHALLGYNPVEFLDLVAIGTVADIVPLIGENRIFVKHGLPRVSVTQNIGLQALLETAKIKGKKMKPYDIGFIIGPRINATGRMDSAHVSLDLLLTQEKDIALELAQALEAHNLQRQKIQRDIVKEAFEIIEQESHFSQHKVIVLSKEGWHKGVLGIVASKITDRYFRPSIVISLKDGIGTASARSVDGFHLYEALESCRHILENFGGHQGAAGLTIKQENIDPFREMINEVAHKRMELAQIEPVLDIEGAIPLNVIDMKFANTIEVMEPFGEGNPVPVFCSHKLTVRGEPRIMGKDTIKIFVSDGFKTLSAIGFGMAEYQNIVKHNSLVDIAYEVIIDDWNKAPTPQLKLKDLRLSQGA